MASFSCWFTAQKVWGKNMKLDAWWISVLPFPVLECLLLFLSRDSLLIKCCSYVVQCEETSAKLWHMEGSGCVVSAVALIWNEVQWLCVWQPSKGWECVTFFGGACLGWESFSSPNSVFLPKVNPLFPVFPTGTDPVTLCILRKWPPTMCFSALCPRVPFPFCSVPVLLHSLLKLLLSLSSCPQAAFHCFSE